MNTLTHSRNQKIIFFIRLICRYFIAFMLFTYAAAKILGTQFSSDLSIDDRTIGSLNGFELTWYFYGYSRVYGVFIATIQIITALLLLFRKTVRMGAVLLLSFMVNIVLLDFVYEIDAAKSMAIVLTAMGFLLLISDWQAFTSYFLKKGLEKTSEPPYFPKKLQKIYKLKYVLIPLMIISTFTIVYMGKQKFMTKNPFYGVWEVTSSEYPNKIDTMYFEIRDRITLKDTTNKLYDGRITTINEEKKILKFSCRHYTDKLYRLVQRTVDTTNKIKEEIKAEKQAIIDQYHKKHNSKPYTLDLNYILNKDTLYVKGKNTDGKVDLKLIKINP